jgi:DNA integrity scanning protein DisA with diadenylate cyclase activity
MFPEPAQQNSRSVLEEALSDERNVNLDILERVLTLAVELAREGREGRKVGTMFVLADAENVMHESQPLILDPLQGHPPANKQLDDPDVWETVKELSQLDGAFVISDSGEVMSAARYINASSQGIELPMGLGSRHMAAASITRATQAAAVVVSESAIVRVFDDGELVSEIIPELWLLNRYGSTLKEKEADTDKRSDDNITVVSKDESDDESDSSESN